MVLVFPGYKSEAVWGTKYVRLRDSVLGPHLHAAAAPMLPVSRFYASPLIQLLLATRMLDLWAQAWGLYV